MSGEAAIEVSNLTKNFGTVKAVRGISFEVSKGELFALLGPNGAGKSTTVDTLVGFRKPSGGSVRVLGYDPYARDREFRERIGVVLQDVSRETALTVEENMRLWGGAYRSRLDIDHVLSLVGLEGRRRRRIKSLSGGERRRLDLGMGLLADPDVLFLDEPTTGFDPEARREAWEVLKAFRGLGRTILLTTHYMEEAQYLADRVAIIAGGRLAACGSLDSLLGGERPQLTFSLPAGVAAEEMPDRLREGLAGDGRSVRIVLRSPTADLAEITGWAAARGLELGELSVSRPSLEDVYLSLVAAAAE